MDEILTRGVETVIGADQLKKAFKSGQKLRVKHGVDPTTPDLHLGYAVVYRKMKALQDLGHQIVILIGDFTGRFGDPDQEKARVLRQGKEVRALAKNYLAQMGKVLDLSKIEVRYNSEWYDKMSVEDWLRIKSSFTVQQILERDLFQKRLADQKPIGAHEPDYPILQGYDSVRLKSDLTVIGSDQLFNELQAHPLQKQAGQPPQAILAMKLLVGTDGQRKMSQSLGNYVGLNDSAGDMFGKVMSIPDELIEEYYELCTDVDMSAVEAAIQDIAAGANPRDTKASLAREITRLYHGDPAAEQAAEAFNRQFQEKKPPQKIPRVKVSAGRTALTELLVEAGLVDSKSEARRLMAQRGVKFNRQTVTADLSVKPQDGDLIQVGKRRFARLKIK
jgi:tyrosyl-tRNA synthetase